MDSAFVLGSAVIVGLFGFARIYQATEIAKTKIENESAVQKAEIYKDRHIQQAKIEAMGYNYGFNEFPSDNSTSSTDNDISSLLALAQSPEGQAFINTLLKKGDK